MLSLERNGVMAYQAEEAKKRCRCACLVLAHRKKDGSCLFHKRCNCPGLNSWKRYIVPVLVAGGIIGVLAGGVILFFQ